MSEPRCDKSSRHMRIAVALQGGGSHGAFTLCVLDRLLLEPNLESIGIGGASAGAMNAAILADGLRGGGGRRPGPRWRAIGTASEGCPATRISRHCRSRAHCFPGTSI